ncbi:hypothetical protein GCM10029976_029330 [Kribbella albertanoniae]
MVSAPAPSVELLSLRMEAVADYYVSFPTPGPPTDRTYMGAARGTHARHRSRGSAVEVYVLSVGGKCAALG